MFATVVVVLVGALFLLLALVLHLCLLWNNLVRENGTFNLSLQRRRRRAAAGPPAEAGRQERSSSLPPVGAKKRRREGRKVAVRPLPPLLLQKVAVVKLDLPCLRYVIEL